MAVTDVEATGNTGLKENCWAMSVAVPFCTVAAADEVVLATFEVEETGTAELVSWEVVVLVSLDDENSTEDSKPPDLDPVFVLSSEFKRAVKALGVVPPDIVDVVVVVAAAAVVVNRLAEETARLLACPL